MPALSEVVSCGHFVTLVDEENNSDGWEMVGVSTQVCRYCVRLWGGGDTYHTLVVLYI